MVSGVRSQRAGSELRERIDHGGLWDGASDSTSYGRDRVRTGYGPSVLLASHLHQSVG